MFLQNYRLDDFQQGVKRQIFTWKNDRVKKHQFYPLHRNPDSSKKPSKLSELGFLDI